MPDKICVLVVEDETLIRMDVADQLEDEGFIVYEAAHADDAIALVDGHPEIRLLFTDIDMPGTMDGLKLAGGNSEALATRKDLRDVRTSHRRDHRFARRKCIFQQAVSPRLGTDFDTGDAG